MYLVELLGYNRLRATPSVAEADAGSLLGDHYRGNERRSKEFPLPWQLLFRTGEIPCNRGALIVRSMFKDYGRSLEMLAMFCSILVKRQVFGSRTQLTLFT